MTHTGMLRDEHLFHCAGDGLIIFPLPARVTDSAEDRQAHQWKQALIGFTIGSPSFALEILGFRDYRVGGGRGESWVEFTATPIEVLQKDRCCTPDGGTRFSARASSPPCTIWVRT